MREPAFWWRPDRGGSLLGPLGAVYGIVAALRLRARGRRAGVTVICLGNPTVGGAGKTPAALTVARFLIDAGERPFFLTRGYGGRLRGPLSVDPASHGAADVGDEPLVLARLAPTIVSRDRVAGAAAARRKGASVIVMDDGFQNPSLAKDLAILLVDGRRGIGNGRIIPAGPLRAPIEMQVARAQAIVIVGEQAGAAGINQLARRHDIPVFRAGLEPDRDAVASIGQRKVLAFAGIGDPEKFFATVAAAGIAIGQRMGFPDHHRYTPAEAQSLIKRAEAGDLLLLTTEKDLARLCGVEDPHLAALARNASALPVRLVVTEADAFGKMIVGAVKRN